MRYCHFQQVFSPNFGKFDRDGFAKRGFLLQPFEPAVNLRTYLLFRPDTQRAVVVKPLTAKLLHTRSRWAACGHAIEGAGAVASDATPSEALVLG